VKGPVHALSVLTGAKSFVGNPILGSARLNEAGLHTARVRAAARMGSFRRASLAAGIDATDRNNFLRDGFIVKPDFLSADEFERLRSEIFNHAWDAREMRQGHTVTRRVFLDAARLRRDRPALAAFMTRGDVPAMMRFAGATGGQPVISIQSILANQGVGADDPQCDIHSDTFHSTSKAWFFLHDVGPADGPFSYVPGSHALTAQRLAWEREQSLAASNHAKRDHAEGSFRISRADLRALGLPDPLPVTVRANTLVVADTFGFHSRTPSPGPTQRFELYATLRRNPFLPWTGLDPLSVPFVKDRMGSFLTALDRAGIAPMPWKPVGCMRLDEPPRI
jgi:hypothetical protein